MTLPGTDWPGVHERIETLRAHPELHKVHGASFAGVGHGFALNPVLSVEELADLSHGLVWFSLTSTAAS